MLRRKKLYRYRYDLLMLAIVVGATLLRLILLLYNWPPTNSDESIMDLMAYHIRYAGEHPTFYYGQSYMAPFEAFIGAALFHIFGVSILTVRLGLLPFYAIFLGCMYYLTSMLYTRGLALFTVGLLSLGSSGLFLHQLLALGGYPEITCFATLMFLLALWLARTAPSKGEHSALGRYWRRRLLYLLLGAVIGLAVWDDLLIAPFILAAGLLLLLFCWRDLLGWASLCLLVGFVFGALPLLIYNLHDATPGQYSWDILLYQHHLGAEMVAAAHITALQQLVGVLLFSIPIVTGFNPCSRTRDMPLYTPVNQHTQACLVTQGVWSAAFIALWLIAVVMVVQTLCSYGNVKALLATELFKKEMARLLLLMTTLITFFMFATSNVAALFPVSSGRYLILFLLATPAILWPLWKQINRGPFVVRIPDIHLHRIIGQFLCIGLLFLVAATYVVGTVETFANIPTAQATFSNEQALSRDMVRLGATRFYSDYWSCVVLIFESRERLICAGLNPRDDRYKPYRNAVQSTPHPAYLFPRNSPLLPQFMNAHKNDPHYHRHDIDGYVLYQYQ